MYVVCMYHVPSLRTTCTPRAIVYGTRTVYTVETVGILRVLHITPGDRDTGSAHDMFS